MVKKRFRRVRAGELAGVIEVIVTGGLPVDTDPDASNRVTKHLAADGRRVKLIGGLPDVLMGETMSAEQRKAHDDATYCAVMGTPGTLGTGTGE